MTRRALSFLAALLAVTGLSGSAPAQVGILNLPYSSANIVAASSGPASVTGTTIETNLAALQIPANAWQPNGLVTLVTLWSYSNNTNNKTLTVRLTNLKGGTTGPVISSLATVTTTATAQTLYMVRNNSSPNAQLNFVSGTNPFAVAGSTIIATTINTTQALYFNINATLANAADTVTLLHAYAVVYPAP